MKRKALCALFAALLAMPTAMAAETPITHIDTPKTVKALYVNLGTAENPNRMARIIGMVERTELNALVIDVRSGGGPLMFGSDTKAKAFLANLHTRNIYAIARIVVFKGGPAGWHDPASRQRWQQVADVSRRALAIGFDEINYDYIRYGSVNEPKSGTPISERVEVIRSFFEFLKREVRDKTGRPISADIFGVTFIQPQPSIGQRLEDAARNFDYVMPMPYPSHWGPGNFGLSNPAHYPYETVYRTLTAGWQKVANDPSRIAKLRTWIQAFDLDSSRPMRYYKYTPWHIQEQIRACYDAGCVGWALWNAGNIYDESAFLKE